VHPGDPVLIPPDPDAAEILVTAPDGARQALRIGKDAPVFVATHRLGVYGVEQVDRSGNSLQAAAFAVNLFDEAESDITPREVVYVGQVEVGGEVKEEEGRREFWPWLAGAGLCVVAGEWWAYHVGTRGGGDRETRRRGARGTR
jgi:hypothetical protein